MPKGVYVRGPGKRSKAQLAGNLPPSKYGRSGYGKKQVFTPREHKQSTEMGGENSQKKTIWLKNLMDIGYGAVGVAPNYGVQSILSLIPSKEIHQAILELNKKLPADAFSPVTHLGFSLWFEIFLKLDELKMIVSDCIPYLEQVFLETEDVLADWTDLDDLLSMEFKIGVTFLEKQNRFKDLTFDEGVGKQDNLAKAAVQEVVTDGFAKFIPLEDIELMKKEKEASLSNVKREELLRLTLNNCLRFPILSATAVEWLGEEFQQGLWRSQNFGALAPISMKAWKLIAGISDSQMEEVNRSANNLTKLIDKVEIQFPCGTSLFDKKCQNQNGITLNVKAHMAYPDIERSYSYLHRVWRCFSPYIKCNCNDSCTDTITWFDQALWYAFNHLDLVYPNYSQAGKMGAFLSFIQLNLKKTVMAHLAYMLVREMLIKVTSKLAANPQCDIKECFGDTKLVEVCEMMVKDKSFMLEKFNQGKEEIPMAGQSSSIVTPSESYLPPRVARQSTDSSCKMIENIAEESVTNVNGTPRDASVSKGEKPVGFMKATELKLGRVLY